jgi:hypothetical protein
MTLDFPALRGLAARLLPGFTHAHAMSLCGKVAVNPGGNAAPVCQSPSNPGDAVFGGIYNNTTTPSLANFFDRKTGW